MTIVVDHTVEHRVVEALAHLGNAIEDDARIARIHRARRSVIEGALVRAPQGDRPEEHEAAEP